jgi:hypothetical protein
VAFRWESLAASTNFASRFSWRRIQKPPADTATGGKRMLDLTKIREKERGLLQRKAKLESDLARLRAQEKNAARRDDTRRKIVLGGALLAAMDSGALSSEIGRKLVDRFVADRDRKLFDGSSLAASAEGAESAPPEAPDDDSRE